MKTIAYSLLLLPMAHAAVVTSTSTHAAGQHWHQANKWSDNAAPSASNDYVAQSGHLIRTPESNTNTFNGGSLTLLTGSTLATKNANSGSTATYTISDLRLSGGTITHFGTGSYVSIFEGTVTAMDGTNSTINISPTSNNRSFTFNSLVQGSGTLTLAGDDAPIDISFTNAANTFTGTFDVTDGILNFDYNHATTALLQLRENGQLRLDQDLSFSSLNLGGDDIAEGTYTQDELIGLNASYGAFFSGASTGNTITVVPEPSSALLVLSAPLFGLLRRRSR